LHLVGILFPHNLYYDVIELLIVFMTTSKNAFLFGSCVWLFIT